MSNEVKLIKRMQSTRNIGHEGLASIAQNKLPVIPENHTQISAIHLDSENLTSPIRKKKKMGKDVEPQNQSGAKTVANDSPDQTAPAPQKTAASIDKNTEVQHESSNWHPTHQGQAQSLHDSGTANILGSYSYDTLLKLLTGTVVTGAAIGIANIFKATDKTPPASPTINAVTNDNVINASESSTGIIVTGTNEANSTTTLNGHAVSQYNATNWYYLLSSAEITALGQGQTTLTAISKDAVGNTSIGSKTILIDTVTTAMVNTIAGDDVINATERDASITITGSNESGATVTVNNQAATVTGTTWSYTLSSAAINAMSQGNNTLTIKATDSVGNNTTTTKTIQVDTQAGIQPQIQLAAATTHWTVAPEATIHTSKGDIVIELNPNAAPITTANWLSYVNSDFFNNLIFHRVMPNFMVQGGGFTADFTQVTPLYPAITLESHNGLSNLRGTIAMARTTDANSATDQFFINTVDNTFLNYASAANPGYAVFGTVISGMDVVIDISDDSTHAATTNGEKSIPDTPTTINSVDQTKAGVAYSSGLVNLVGLESGAHWEYALDSSSSWLTAASSSLQINSTDGQHSLAVRQVDAAGNASKTSSIDFILDHTAPIFTSSSTVTAVANHAGPGLSVYDADATDLGQIIYSLKAGSDSALSINKDTGVVTLANDPDNSVQSSYDFTVIATDWVGNQSELHLNMAVLPI